MVGCASLKHQVYQALSSINVIDDQKKRKVLYEKYSGQKANNIAKIGKKQYKSASCSAKVIISISSMKSALKTANNFVFYCKQNEDIKLLKEIKSNMIVEYLQKKKDEGCKPATLKTYYAALKKLNYGIKEKYGGKGFIDKTNDKMYFGKREIIGRKYSELQIEMVIKGFEGSRYQDAIKIQAALGLRASEIKTFKLDNIQIGKGDSFRHRKFGQIDTTDTVKIIGKGGLIRFVPIQNKYKVYIKDFKERYEGNNQPFRRITKNAYQKKFFRITKKLFESRASYRTHEIRKYYATQLFLDLKKHKEQESGRMLSKEEQDLIKKYVVYTLGHSEEREDLIKIYINA